jgi:hypothetical protein
MVLLSHAQIVDYDNAERRRHPAIYREVPSSAQIGPAETNEIFKQQLLSSSHQSRYLELEQAFIELRDQMARLRLVRENWDSYGASRPDEAAFSAVEAALRAFRDMNVRPNGIMPSAEGGIGIMFTEREEYAHIEFDNSGETWVLTYGPDRPATTWQLPSRNADSLREAWNRISASLQS